MSIKLSIIIPCYNGEEYLSKCLNSLLSQDISQDEYEIVCVDDFSSDNSINLIKKYQESYSNISLIVNSKNSGVASTLNNGISAAKGDYIWVIGQDDYIKEHCLSAVLNNLFANRLDIILFNYHRVNEHGTMLEDTHVFDMEQSMSGIDFINKRFGNSFVHYILGFTWRSIIKRSFLLDNNIHYIPNSIFEDTTYLFKSICYSKNVASIPDYLYFYRVNQKSIMYNLEVAKKASLIYEFAFLVGDEVENFSNELKSMDLNLSNTLFEKAIWYYNTFALELIRTSYEEKKKFYELLNKNRKFVTSKYKYLKFISRLLIIPHIGFYISLTLKFIYKIKKSILSK